VWLEEVSHCYLSLNRLNRSSWKMSLHVDLSRTTMRMRRVSRQMRKTRVWHWMKRKKRVSPRMRRKKRVLPRKTKKPRRGDRTA